MATAAPGACVLPVSFLLMEIPTLTFSSFSLIPRKSYSKGKLIALLVKQSYNKANARNLSKVWYAIVLKSFFKY